VLQALKPLLLQGQVLWRAQGRRISIGVLGIVALATGGAYAVVSIAPQDAQVPVRVITETVDPLYLLPSTSELEGTRLPFFYSTTTRTSDTVDSLLSRLNVVDQSASQFFRSDPQTQHGLMAAGRLVKAQTDEQRRLLQMTIIWPSDQEGQFNRIRVERGAQGFRSQMNAETLKVVRRFAAGRIESSLFAATDQVGIPDAVAAQIAEVFSGEIDFHRSLRKGDRFSVVYEALLADGELLRTGRVVASEFLNAGKTYQAVWFEHTGVKGGYYGPDGKSLTHAFLASPLEFSRVTSGFSMRMHPILKKWRAHLGVDYGAPTGTSVRAVGAGVVSFAGVQGGFGNVVFIDHGKNKTTVYAHLSAIRVKKGQTVEQGQSVGAVGSSGWATGPHLHFEFRMDGKHVDPVLVAREAQYSTVPTALLPTFKQTSESLARDLASASTMLASSAR
jgi:murein DD-endopeptidase MepM/ murein hydrolase activator NlpD